MLYFFIIKETRKKSVKDEIDSKSFFKYRGICIQNNEKDRKVVIKIVVKNINIFLIVCFVPVILYNSNLFKKII